ncbi:MAG: ImmA/IrrE family metallo-endopeptidase [Verrucomicrobia bacterium]|nr:ImmA/IrrE family metallo-endopeptidase [Verrucomicrobiota bacterium]
MTQGNLEIGQRIKIERERKKLSQYTLAKAIGWNHHQIVSEVEQGKREVKARELYEIAKFLFVDIDVLLGKKTAREQPFVLWREKPTENEELLKDQFLQECDNYVWIEELISQSEKAPILISKELPTFRVQLERFTLEQAYELAESMRGQMGLGDFPAAQLIDILEDGFGVKFIVDQKNIKPSGACFRSEKGCFIFINGRNTEPRQLFSIAHELFHLITWDAQMLKSVDTSQPMHEKNELLANAFAAGLLIPQEKLHIETKKIAAGRRLSAADIIALAQKFQVSKEAMLNRMHNTYLLTKKEHEQLQIQFGTLFVAPALSVFHPLKAKFVRLVYLAMEHLKISRAKAAKLLHVELCDLSPLLNEYGFVEITC